MATPITIPAGRAMQNYASSALSDMQNDHQQQRPTRASCVTLKHINEDSPLVTPVRTTTRIAPATAATAPIAVADGLASSATTAAHQQIAAAAAMSTATPVTATTPGRRRQRRRTRASESCTAEFRDEYEFVGGQDGFLGEGAYAVVRTGELTYLKGRHFSTWRPVFESFWNISKNSYKCPCQFRKKNEYS